MNTDSSSEFTYVMHFSDFIQLKTYLFLVDFIALCPSECYTQGL